MKEEENEEEEEAKTEAPGKKNTSTYKRGREEGTIPRGRPGITATGHTKTQRERDRERERERERQRDRETD